MFYILHQHYESVLRLLKLVDPKQLNKFYNIFNEYKFLNLKPTDRLKFLQKSLPIPEKKHFTVSNFYRIAQQIIEEMVQYKIAHIDLITSIRLERWRDINDISQAKDMFNKILDIYKGKTISFLAGVNLTKTRAEIEKSITTLFKDKVIDSIVGIDINIGERDIYKFNKYYKILLKIRDKHNKKINVHLGEFTSNKFNYEIIKRIRPDRIGHGIRLLKSPHLCKIIKDNNICLEVCPVSNKITGVVNWNKFNPIKEAINLGIPVTINTDDPIMFNTNINKEIKTANLNENQIQLLLNNSLKYHY